MNPSHAELDQARDRFAAQAMGQRGRSLPAATCLRAGKPQRERRVGRSKRRADGRRGEALGAGGNGRDAYREHRGGLPLTNVMWA